MWKIYYLTSFPFPLTFSSLFLVFSSTSFPLLQGHCEEQPLPILPHDDLFGAILSQKTIPNCHNHHESSCFDIVLLFSLCFAAETFPFLLSLFFCYSFTMDSAELTSSFDQTQNWSLRSLTTHLCLSSSSLFQFSSLFSLRK